MAGLSHRWSVRTARPLRRVKLDLLDQRVEHGHDEERSERENHAANGRQRHRHHHVGASTRRCDHGQERDERRGAVHRHSVGVVGAHEHELRDALDGNFDPDRAHADGQRFLKAIVDASFDMRSYNRFYLDKFEPESVEDCYATLVRSLEPNGASA